MNNQIVFVDSLVENYQTLIEGVAPQAEIVVLDAKRSGVEQITEILASRTDIEAVHIISHGSEGSLRLGADIVAGDNLESFSSQIKQWGEALTEKADILLYGCNVAAGTTGVTFVENLSNLTGADIAASADLTGNSSLGGDWNLEFSTGQIETSLAFQPQVLQAYNSVLPTQFVNETFTGSSISGAWSYGSQGGNSASLTASSGIDSPGNGALRLTSNAQQQAGFIFYNQAISATTGVKVNFEFFAYNSTTGAQGADGLSFFLIDGNANPTQAGARGGSIGYAQALSSNQPGLQGGYIGIGFDEFGNFASTDGDRIDGPGARPDAVTIRGSQSSNYAFLTTANLPGGIDNPTATNRNAATRKVQIILTPSNSAIPNRLSVAFDLNNNGSFTDSGETIIAPFDVTTVNGAVPSSFKFGFAAGTGGSTNIHEVRNFVYETFDPSVVVSSSTVTAATVAAGATNRLLYQLNLQNSTGISTAAATFNGLTVNTGGTYQTSDVAANGFKLWYSDDSIFGNGNDSVLSSRSAVASGGNLTFNGFSRVINDGNTGYLFLTADVAAGANNGATINIAAPSLSNISFVQADKTGTTFTGNSLTVDSLAPTVTLTSPSSNTTNAPFTVTASFSEDVANFNTSDLNISNGSLSNFTVVNARTYTFDVTPSVQGLVTVSIPANSASDAAGNNIAAAQLTRTYDSIGPTVTLASTSTFGVTSSFSVTATFSEDVTGFDASDLAIGNGSASNFTAVDTKTYTFDVTPTAEGLVTVDVSSAIAQDAVGNNNSAATQLQRVYDVTPPSVTLTSTASNFTNAPFSVTATFDEEVTGFDTGDIVVANGNVSNFTVVDAETYTFTVTPAAEGLVTVDTAASAAQDVSGNNTAATQLSRTYDGTVPTVTLASTAANRINTPFTVTATFSENVIGFDASDIIVSNGSVSNFNEVNGSTYTFDIDPTASGTVTVDIADAVAQDAASNSNTAATQLSRTYDITSPGVTLTSTAPNLTNAPFSVTAAFNEDVVGFDATDIILGNGSASNFTAVNGQTYTFDVTPTAAGQVTVDIAAAAAQDTVGNNSTAAQLSRNYDGTAPSVTLTSTAPDPTNAPFTVTAAFSEDVLDFDASDISVSNSIISNFTAVDARTYTFDITPTANGLVTVDVAAAAARDNAGNNNAAATQLSRTFDSVNPIVTLSSIAAANTNAPFTVTAAFNTDVTGFDSSDITVANGTFSNFAAVDPKTYTFTVTPTVEGAVTVDVPAGVAQDAATNPNTAALQLSRTYDTTAPGVTLTSTSPALTKDPFNVTATFSENVTDFTSNDVTVANGNVSNFNAVNANTYTFTVTPTAQGVVTVDVAASAAQDRASNPNTAATQLSRTYDSITPSVTIGAIAPNSRNIAVSSIPITFSEVVTGFDLADLTLTRNGTPITPTGATLSGSGASYTLDNLAGLTATEGNYRLTLTASGAGIADSAGNALAANTSSSWNTDTTAPTAATTLTNITASSPNYQIVVNYSDNVGVSATTLQNTNIRVTGANGFNQLATLVSSNTSGSTTAATYAINAPGGLWDIVDNGTYTVSLEASQVGDSAGNFVAASNLGTFTVNVPNKPPAISSSSTLSLTLDEGKTAAVSNTQLRVNDPDNTAAEITYRVTNSPVNGTLLLAGAAIGPNGTFTQADIDAGNITYTHSGSETTADSFKFTVADSNGGTLGTQTFNFKINPVNAAPVAGAIAAQTAAKGNPFLLQLAANTFTDIDAGDFLTYSATKVDGSALPAWLAFNPATRTFSGTPQNSDVGVLGINVQVRDTANATAATTFNLTVPNSAPAIAAPIASQFAFKGAPFLLQFPIGTFTDADTGETLTYSATRADGSALPAWLNFDAATRTFSGTPVSDSGTFGIKVRATDSANATAETTFNLTIPNNAPTVAANFSPQLASQGVAFNYKIPDNIFRDIDGDRLNYSATLDNGSPLPQWLRLDATSGTFSGTPTESGVYNLVVRATDPTGASASTTLQLTAQPPEPVLNIQDFKAGIQTGLGELTTLLNSDLAGASLPFLGQLSDKYVPDFLKNLAGSLVNGMNSTEMTVSAFRNQISQNLPGVKVSVDTATAGQVELTLDLTKTYELGSVSLDSDLEIPLLNFSTSGTANAGVTGGMQLTFGFNANNGFYFNTNPSKTYFGADLGINLSDNFSAKANLSFLQLDLQNDTDNPTGVNAGFKTFLKDLDNTANSRNDGDRLTLTELRQSGYRMRDLFGSEFAITPNLGLKGKTSVQGSDGLPSINFDLALDWDAFKYRDGKTEKGKPKLEFNDVQLDLGTFITNFAKPVLTRVNNVVAPFRPIIQFLNADTRIFSQLDVGGFDQNRDGKVTVIEVGSKLYQAKGGKPFDTRFLDGIAALDQATQALNEVSSSDGNITIDLGSYSIGTVDPDASQSTLRSQTPRSTRTAANATSQASKNSKAKNFLDALNRVEGLGFPILSQPTEAINLLLGKDATLFRYDMPDLNIDFNIEQGFPVIWPLKGTLRGGFKATTNLEFGYDTYGFSQWKNAGYSTSALSNLIDGFYVVDQPGDEIKLDASVGAGFGADVVVAEGRIEGGIKGNAGIDLIDVGEHTPNPNWSGQYQAVGQELDNQFRGLPLWSLFRNGFIRGALQQRGVQEYLNNSDSKLRTTEITSRITKPFELFQIAGAVSVYLDAYARLGWPPIGDEWRKNLATFEIANFSIGPAGKGGRTANKYISGATVFLDTNFDSILDANEPFTFSSFDGTYNLNYAVEQFDTNANGQIDPTEGQLVSLDGYDTFTYQDIDVPLSAPITYNMVTPVTTLINTLVRLGSDVAQAQTQVKQALGLPTEVDLATFDAIAAMLQGDPNGARVMTAHVAIYTLLDQATSLMGGASGLSQDTIAGIITASLAYQINTGKSIDLTQVSQIQELLTYSTSIFQQFEPNQNWQQVLDIADEAAQVMAEGTQRMANILSQPGPATEILERVSQLQAYLVSETAADLQAAASGTMPIEQVVAENTGSNLDAQVQAFNNPPATGEFVFPSDFSAVFNPLDYLNRNPDVAAAVAKGDFQSAFQHFSLFGLAEGRSPSAEFDMSYLDNNPDVAAAVTKGDFQSGFQHFMTFGMAEGRVPSPQLAAFETFYLTRNPDVAQAVQQGKYGSGLEHLIKRGMAEGRDPIPDLSILSETFDSTFYLANNPDVAQAVDSKVFQSGFQHFVNFGMAEGRDPGAGFNNSVYLANNSDVAQAVIDGDFQSGFQHYMLFGAAEGRISADDTSLDMRTARTVTGEVDNDTLLGGFGNDSLMGDAGDDILVGGFGDDLLAGGDDRDLFVLAPKSGTDAIADFNPAEDLIGLSRGLKFDQLQIAQGTGSQAADTLIRYQSNDQVLASLTGIAATSITPTMFAIV